MNPANAGGAVVIARDVRYRYPRAAQEVLAGVTLDIAAAEVAVLWGLNGAGKTTLGKVLCGLFKPVAGEVLWPAGPVTMVLASPERALLGDTPYEDVRLGPALARLNEAEVERRTVAALAAVDLWCRRDVPCAQLSLGEQKRVALAAALALAPAAIILDEPFAFLDDEQVAAFAATIGRLAREEGRGVFILTGRRDPGVPYDRALTLRGGRVTEGLP